MMRSDVSVRPGTDPSESSGMAAMYPCGSWTTVAPQIGDDVAVRCFSKIASFAKPCISGQFLMMKET